MSSKSLSVGELLPAKLSSGLKWTLSARFSLCHRHSTHLANHRTLRVQSQATALAANQVFRVMEQLMDCITLQVWTFLAADLALDRSIGIFLLRLFDASAAVKFELVLGAHHDILADRTIVTRRFQEIVDFHDMSVVAAELVEEFITSFDFALHFLHLTLVRFVSFLAGEFLLE